MRDKPDRIRCVLLAVSLMMLGGSVASAQQRLMTAGDVLGLDPIPADHRVAYGEHPKQFGDLRLPDGDGPHPVAVMIHGGCWLDEITLEYFDRAAVALTEAGVATWSIEYRGANAPDGGWPNTFLDVGAGLDHLRALAAEHPLDLDRVVTVGHSAGGHMALWAAGRARIPTSSELYVADALPVAGAVSLGGVPELRRTRDMDQDTCGSDVIDTLMGGGPRDVPARYRAGSPFQLLPLNVPQRHITGREDGAVPPAQVRAYNYESQSAGDDSQMIVLPDAGHWEVVWPGSAAWPVVEENVLALLGAQRD